MRNVKCAMRCAYNNVKLFTKIVFSSPQGLKKLHTLHMYNNQLERVPRGLPRRAKTLMLLHNGINEIGRNDLVMLYTLTELNLSYNRLISPKLHREGTPVNPTWNISLSPIYSAFGKYSEPLIIFRSPELFDRVQVRALAGPLKDIQRLC